MADNDVLVRYILRDEATPGIRRIQAEVEAADRQMSRLGSNSRVLRFFDALDGKTGNLSSQFRSLDSDLMGVSRRMQTDLVHGLGLVTAGLTAAAGAATFFGLRAVNSFQHTQAAFSVLTGSMANGQRLYDQLMALNLRSPFDMQPLASSAQTLLGFRVPQQQLLPILQSISNVAAVQQDPNEALMRMSLAIGQINQSGTVRAQDLNQLVQAGFPAYQLIPGGKAGLLAGHGTIPSRRFLNQLLQPGQGPLAPYGDASAAMNMTLSGQWSNLTTLVRQEAIKDFSGLGNDLVTEMKPFTDTLTGVVHGLAPTASLIGTDLVKGAEALLPVLTPLLKAGGSGLHQLLTAGAPFLAELERQDPAISAALGELFSTLAGEAPVLADLFGDLVSLMPPFVHALDDAVQLVDPVLKLVDGLLSLGPVRQVVADLLFALLAYRTLAPAIKAVIGMRDALFGLAAAEEAAAVAGGGAAGGAGRAAAAAAAGGAAGRRGGVGRGIAGAAGLGLLIPGVTDIRGRGIGSDLSTISGAALTGFSVGGPPGAFAGAVLGGSWDLGVHTANWIWGGKQPTGPSADLLARQAAYADALSNDPKLAALMSRGHVTVNMTSGAIVVHGAKDDQALAKQIRDELGTWIAERQERR